MDYKKIIKSRASRSKILKMLSFIPDKQMLKIQYWVKTGRMLNLNNPKRFTEKIQWYKLYYKNPLLIQCVDKYDVRQFISNRGFGDILNKCFGVYDHPNQIKWDELPEKLVIKSTLGGGSNKVIIIKDKKSIDYEAINEKLSRWIIANRHRKNSGREWPYYMGRNARIIIEDYLEESSGDLVDYKFFCFDGKVKYFYIRTGYSGNHDAAKIAFFDRECNYLPGVGFDYCNIAEEQPILPNNIKEMIQYADALSQDFPHVRVDFYNIDGQIVFGELTFYHASGYMLVIPDEWDYKFGEDFNLIKYSKR